MANLKHYISKLSAGDDFFSARKKLTSIMTCLGLFHFGLAGLFLYNHLYILMLFGFFSGLYFIILVRNLIKKEKYIFGMVMAIMEVILTAFVCTIYLGFGAGFSMYLFACISAIFYITFIIEALQKKDALPLMFSLLLLISYIVNYALMLFIEPVTNIKGAPLERILHITNCSISIIMIIVFNFLFMWEMRARNKMLSDKNEQLDIMAHRDPLTRLLNRRSMSERMKESMNSLKVSGRRFSLILADIDDFKHVNDTFGHDAGDLVLVTVANIMKESLREEDVVCRWGGEEFLILIKDPIEMATLSADKIRKNVEASEVNFARQTIKITLTLGVAESIPGYRIEQLIQQADDKLYKGKKNGKNCVVV